jgi:hypothetical protein
MTEDTNTTTRMLALPAAIIFSIGSGDTAEKISRDTAGMTDTALTMLLQYGTRKLNDTRNGAQKEAWGQLHGQALVDAFLAWADAPKASRAPSASVPTAIIQAIKEYLAVKRKIAAWKKAEAKQFDKIPTVKSLDQLREYLGQLTGTPNGLMAEDKWFPVKAKIEENARVIEAGRALLAEEDDIDSLV